MPSVTYVGLPVLQAKARAALTAGVDLAANDLVRRAQAAAPVVTGTLEGSIHTDGAHGGGDTVTAKVSTGGEADAYALFVHEGTRPHPIDPVNGQALAFNGIVVKHVNHPGTRPQRFLGDPLAAMASTYARFIAEAASAEF